MKLKLMPLLSLFVIAMVLALVLPRTVSASFLGGKIAHTTGQAVKLGVGSLGSYSTQIQAASTSWQNTPTLIYTYWQQCVSGGIDVTYRDSSDASYAGLTVHTPCYGGGSGCIYTSVNIYMSTAQLGGTTNFTRQKVAAHELGHAIGLAHTTTSSTSIMKLGVLTYNTPQNYDINDTNSLYP